MLLLRFGPWSRHLSTGWKITFWSIHTRSPLNWKSYSESSRKLLLIKRQKQLWVVQSPRSSCYSLLPLYSKATWCNAFKAPCLALFPVWLQGLLCVVTQLLSEHLSLSLFSSSFFFFFSSRNVVSWCRKSLVAIYNKCAQVQVTPYIHITYRCVRKVYI